MAHKYKSNEDLLKDAGPFIVMHSSHKQVHRIGNWNIRIKKTKEHLVNIEISLQNEWNNSQKIKFLQEWPFSVKNDKQLQTKKCWYSP